MRSEGTGSEGDDAARRALGQRLRAELEACVEAWLRPYIDRLKADESQPRPKVINDAVWGSIRLYQWEVAVLDTWLLQRLRFLRQLGVVHWVYPTGGHSRLEHSLGVLHQMDAMLTALERTGRVGGGVLTDAMRKLLRLAALLHDTGHAIMSHVSEAFVRRLPGVAELCDALFDEFRPRKVPSPSEAFAAVFVQSPAFRELLALPVVGASFIRDVREATKSIAGFILGAPVVPRAAYLTLLVNGAFDADKLDYMPRDCLLTGVPCTVDVRRVIETIRVLTVPADVPQLRRYVEWAGLTGTLSVDVLTLTGSGARALGELATARSLLYEKVYFHHKVRALEVMVRRALPQLSKSTVTEWLNVVDDELLLGSGAEHFEPVRRRELLKRAVVFTPPEGGDGEQQTPDELAWMKLMTALDDQRLQQELARESVRVANLLQRGVDALRRSEPELDAPPIKKIGLDQDAFVGDSVEEFGRASASLSGQRTEAGRRAAQQTVYVFAPEGAVLPVFVAARELARRRFGLVLGADAYRSTRLDPEVIASAEEALAKAGYFSDGVPAPILPARIRSHREEALETFLRTSRSRLDDLSVKFGQYQPFDEAPVSPERIAAFLRQFGKESLARSALLVLEAVDFKDRRFFASALQGLLKHAPLSRIVSPLGAVGDSSAFISYLMNDLRPAEKRDVLPLELALDPDGAETDGSILLWDDFCGRAGHAATTIAQWLSLPTLPGDSDILLNERLVRPLSPDRVESFKGRDVAIAFALARPSGVAELRHYLTRHGLVRVRVLDPHALVGEGDQLFTKPTVLADEKDRTELRAFLQQRMRLALRHNLARTHDPWTEEKLERRLLGYGNEAHLVVFSYNVPTVTLTALWTGAPTANVWSPLFIRRGKPGV